MSAVQDDPHPSRSAAERLELFRRQAARQSPVKTRARTRGILAEKKPALNYGRGKKPLAKADSDPGVTCSASLLAPAATIDKATSPQKRARSPLEEANNGGQGSPAKKVAPVRSPGRTRVCSGPPAPSFVSFNDRVSVNDPFALSATQHLVDGEGRPLLLRKLSIGDEPMDLSPSQRLIQATNDFALDFSAMPAMPLSGFAALKKSLGLAQSYPLPSSPLAHGLPAKRSLTRSRSSPCLMGESMSMEAGPVALAASPALPSFLVPSPLSSLPEPGPTPAPAESTSNHGLLSAMASRPSHIPRFAIQPATPSVPRPAEAAFVSNSSIPADLANRLTSLEQMMSSMAGKEPRRRHSSIEKLPPKTPLVGGHHLRRRVSAPDATPTETKPSHARRSSIAPTNRGSLLPIASASSALAVMEELSPTKKGMAIEEAEPMGMPLDDVTAFVDVRTSEGDEAGQVFIEMLKSLGAKVLVRLTPNVTHVIYKSGRPQTLTRARSSRPPPHILAVGWVVQCREKGEHVDETPFVLKPRPEPLFKPKKRRAMEPRHTHLQALDTNTQPLAALERTKQIFMRAPKVGSPLKQAMPMSDSTSDVTMILPSSPTM